MSVPPRISDHAVLCYLARKQGLDVKAVRRDIQRQVHQGLKRLESTPDLQATVNGVQSDGMTFRLRGEVVVTCFQTSRPERGHG